MKALAFNIRLNSLYSIRIPYTWQSALSYPILPPSAVIGILANAYQRYKNDKNPLKYLDLIEKNLVWAGSRLLSPCVIKSYTTSAIVKWKDKLGEKFTNALGRQFAYCKNLQILAIFKENGILMEVLNAIKKAPLFCGDSESLASLEGEIFIKDIKEDLKEEISETSFPFPFDKDTKIVEGNGQVFFMHGRCKKVDKNFPLTAFIVPVREEKGIVYPSYLKVKITKEKPLRIDEIGDILLKEVKFENINSGIKKKIRKKK